MDFEEFRRSLDLDLTEEQITAIQSVERPTLLLAVPGSGKTTVLVARLGYMLYVLGIDKSSVLTLTYTVAATGDMKKRFSSLFGIPENSPEMPEFRTINGICSKIIYYFENTYGVPQCRLVSEEKSQYMLLLDAYRRVSGEYPTEADISNLRTLIVYAKNSLLAPDEVKTLNEELPRFDEMFAAYNDSLRQKGLIDYDDQMLYAYDILQKYPEVLEHFRETYRYICVDEAQDTSKVQHLIIELLAKKYNCLFMVGDEDQSIYSFRAAYPDALLHFEENWPNANVLLMETNFRSCRNVVLLASRFIRNNQMRHRKDMFSSTEEKGKIREIRVPDRMCQYEYFGSIREEIESSDLTTAVLYRDNECAIPLIDFLERNGMSYRSRQMDATFFTNRVVKDVTDILKFAYEPSNTALFMQIYYKINGGFTKWIAEDACRISTQKKIPLMDAVLGVSALRTGLDRKAKILKMEFSNICVGSAVSAVRRIVDVMGYGDYLRRNRIDSGKVDILLALARKVGKPTELLSRLAELREIVQRGGNDPDAKLVLSTIHGSKGLEYDKVYLLDVFDGMLPKNPPRFLSEATPEQLRAYEEERRIFFVGMTRARKELVLFNIHSLQSTFLTELFPSSEPNAEEGSEKKSEAMIRALMNSIVPGSKVVHATFGEGTVLEKNGQTLLVSFAAGEKKLAGSVAIAKGLLKVIT